MVVVLIKFQLINSIQSYHQLHQADYFKNADLHTGYFCYTCTYFIEEGNHWAIVEDSGPDVREQESGIIAPFAVCTLWHPNELETR